MSKQNRNYRHFDPRAVVIVVLAISTTLFFSSAVQEKGAARDAAPQVAVKTRDPVKTKEKARAVLNQKAPFCLDVPVLLYHHVQPFAKAKAANQTKLTVDVGTFDRQMAYLWARGYTTLTAKQLVDAIRLKGQLPAKSVVLTFDDGYRDVFEYAYPILQKYHMMANLAIATGLLDGSGYLSWGQLEEMVRSGGVYLIDHTWSHYPVGKGPFEKVVVEIETARQQLEQHTGQKVDVFAYPFGSSSNLAISVLQKGGFIGAFSTTPGFSQCDWFIMALHRNRIGNAPLAAYGL